MTAATITHTDEQIQREVLAELEWEARVRSTEIGVAVKDGVVTLTGWVDSYAKKAARGVITLRGEVSWQFEKRAAERAVRRLAGVRGIINAIRVRPPVSPSPERLTRQIQDALVHNAETDAERIRVEVHGDRIILRGTVRSWAEKDEAERVAWSAPGVISVDNLITVEP